MQTNSNLSSQLMGIHLESWGDDSLISMMASFRSHESSYCSSKNLTTCLSPSPYNATPEDMLTVESITVSAELARNLFQISQEQWIELEKQRVIPKPLEQFISPRYRLIDIVDLVSAMLGRPIKKRKLTSMKERVRRFHQHTFNVRVRNRARRTKTTPVLDLAG